MKKVPLRLLCFVALFGLSACGDTSDPAPAAESEPASGAASDALRAAEAAAESTDRGTLSLAVDGQARSFTHFPTGKNLAMSMSTMILARPSAEATEEFSIAVMSFDLAEAELPLSLELGLREAMESDNPGQFASRPKPLISYVSPEGTDYSAYATVVFERYEDGVVTGRVEDQELEPSDGEGPTIMLSDVRFEVAL